MGKISDLPVELLIKILLLLPTKVAVSTSVLSKQWEFLWMCLPKLEYLLEFESKRLKCFLDRNLPLHRAPVIESFRLQFHYLEPGDIKLWVSTVVSRYVRELDISYWPSQNKPDILPSSLYTCKSLVTLKLYGKILVAVPRMVCLPCLKTLRLQNLSNMSEDSLHRLLSNCPVLEDLSVEECENRNIRKFSVIVPSLQRLTLVDIGYGLDEFVISTPSLEYLKLEYFNIQSHHFSIENMPKLREAFVVVGLPYIKRLIGSITSVTSLTLCLLDYSSEAVYGTVFKHLVHLKLCICRECASTVLVRLLKDSPKLRVLDLYEVNDHVTNYRVLLWNQPSTVPECMLSSLQTFKFEGYYGRPEERDLATYILQNARRLKTATILPTYCWSEKTSDKVRELALSPRASTECQLIFDR